MSDVSVRLDRLKQQVLGLLARTRPHHLVLMAVLAVVGIGLVAVRAVALPGPRAVSDGERLQIEVVAPVEPDVAPGSVMEVGSLVDGFEYTPPPAPVAEPAAYAAHEEDFETPKPRSAPSRYVDEAVIQAPPQPESQAGGWRDSRAGRWFGFDAPERDYRAEREERRARREMRVERDRDGREIRRYRSDGAPDDRY